MSALHFALKEYLEFRRRLGSQLREPGIALRSFVDFVEAQGLAYITVACAFRWATQSPDVQPATWGRRLGHVRGFARWLQAVDPRTEVPGYGLLSSRHRRNAPHIYSDSELLRLMDEAARMRSRSGLRPLTYVTLIGLLASTGLRPGEALRLDISDVDFDQHVLLVRESKFGKSRFVPFSDSTRRALARYMKRRQRLWQPGWSDALLVSEGGDRLHGCTVRTAFAHLAHAVGIRPQLKRHRLGRGPRLQDIRHTFATRRLIEWYRAGADVNRKMPLRHALACTMLRRGASLREIGEVLRHRSPDTTTLYAKVDVAALRALAQAWPLPGGAA